MRILAAAPTFPSTSHPFAGIFTANIVATLRELGHDVVVLCPTPFVPPGLANVGRWKQYADIAKESEFEGVPVYRPSTVVIPRLFQAFWSDEAAWLGSRRFVKQLHQQKPFDAVIGFDLGGAGGLAWRLAKDLGVPAAGWAYGSEVRINPTTGPGKSVSEAINKLNVVFYQSSELRECAASMVNRDLANDPRQLVLPHGIRIGETRAPSVATAANLRKSWGAEPDDRIILSIGRVRRDKGVFDLVEAFAVVGAAEPLARLVIVGAMPPRDDSEELSRQVAMSPFRDRIRVMPALEPSKVPDAMSTADIFAFTSYLEGMPNVVLEALLFETPTVAFDIPPLREADPESSALTLVPKGDVDELAAGIAHLLNHQTDAAARTVAGHQLLDQKFNMRRNLATALETLRHSL
jgi:glycosyltransferase involved in cell wall biosynthesis